MIRRLEFHVSYSCAQDCLFCSESARMRRHGPAPVRAAEIARVLAVKRRLGFDHLTLTGGEPTLHPDFIGVLRAAKGLGFSTYVTSNGWRLAEPAFAGRALAFIDELCLSVHGDGPRLHEALTRTPGGFSRLLEAFRRAAASPGTRLRANTVVTRLNWGRIEAVLAFVLDQGVRHPLLSHVAPEGAGGARYRSLAVPWAEWRRKVPALARLAEGRGATLRVFGVPLCVLGPAGRVSNDLHFSPRVTVERGAGGRLVEIVSLRPDRRRVQPASCAPCGRRGDCGGVFDRHLAEFGEEGLGVEAAHAG